MSSDSAAGNDAHAAESTPLAAEDKTRRRHQRHGSSGDYSEGTVPPLQASEKIDSASRYRKDQMNLINKVGMDVISPLSIKQPRTPKGYVRGEMLTPSPPPGWHATPGYAKHGDNALVEMTEVFRNGRAPFDNEGSVAAPTSGSGAVVAPEGVEVELEEGKRTAYHRHKSYINYLTVTCTHVVIGYALGTNAYHLISDTLKDGYWQRCIVLLYYPAAYVFLLFSVDYLVAQVIYALGPIAHMQQNSKYFSSVPMPRPAQLPKITIQMPVYKESLSDTILPSLQSLTTAILHYKKVGGEANILVCDDGLAGLKPVEKDARIFTYKRHGVSYIARPKAEVRARRGLFKKASNMNYCLNVCSRIQERMDANAQEYEEAVTAVCAEGNNEFRIGGDVRIGEIILLVDSDTRVPESCLAQISGEFDACPEVGFLQCRSTSLRINENYWENMIARFTDDVYGVGIAMAVSSGDPAPLVGHNVFLRWGALKDVSVMDGQDGERKFWSEHHVSEDFDMALRLQTHGYIGRYCMYTGEGFQEGVSLTAVDEVVRLRKYAFGSCEIMLNPFKDWLCHGPVTGMFRRYLGAKGVPMPAKIRMVAYLSTYIAMAFSIYGIVLHLLFWIFLPAALKFITSPFDILLTVCFVFGVMSVFGAAMIRYRTGASGKLSLFGCFFQQMKNAPIMLLFFSHVLWHLTVVCFKYFFSTDVEWTSSVKEAEHKTFGTELKDTFTHYWRMFLTMFMFAGAFAGAIIYFNVVWDVRVYVPISVYVGCHVLGPFLLNPTIMRGYY